MNTELIVGFLALINVIVLVGLMIVIRDVVSIKLLSTQLHNAVGTIVNRMQQQDVYLNKLGNAFTDFTSLVETVVDKLNDQDMIDPRRGMLYRTIDGKYAAPSLQDLIDKIKNDGQSDNYLSKDEIDDIRKLFDTDNDEEEDDNNYST